MTTKFISLSLVLLGVAVLAAAPANAQKDKEPDTIKKCQDPSGAWHYGNFAAQECERAKITEINQRGITVKERARVLTREELAEKKAARDKAKAERKKQAAIRKQEKRLLATYESADAIVRARDDRVIAIDREVTANNTLKEKYVDEAKKLAKSKDKKQKKRMKSVQAQIALFDEANKALAEQREEVIERYNDLYMKYQALVQKNTGAK